MIISVAMIAAVTIRSRPGVIREIGRNSAVIAARVRVGALRELGRLREADQHVPAMVDLAAKHANPGNRARANLEIARLRLTQGRGGEGLPFARRAVEALEPTQIPESALLKSARNVVVACETATAGPA
jgi:hypothetical protein